MSLTIYSAVLIVKIVRNSELNLIKNFGIFRIGYLRRRVNGWQKNEIGMICYEFMGRAHSICFSRMAEVFYPRAVIPQKQVS